MANTQSPIVCLPLIAIEVNIPKLEFWGLVPYAGRSGAALLKLSDNVQKIVHGSLLKAHLKRCGGFGWSVAALLSRHRPRPVRLLDLGAVRWTDQFDDAGGGLGAQPSIPTPLGRQTLARAHFVNPSNLAEPAKVSPVHAVHLASFPSAVTWTATRSRLILPGASAANIWL
jgi:hypothetical protein